MAFKPFPTRSGYISLSIVILAGLSVAYLIYSLFQRNDLPGAFQIILALFVSLILMGIATYWTVLAFKLHYHLNRNGIAIQWGLARHLIPFETIEAILPASDFRGQFKGINIAGLRFGWGEDDEYGKVRFHTTANLIDSLLVVTPRESYIISPDQPDRFIEAWQARQRLGPTQHWGQGLYRNWPFSIPLLKDPLSWSLWGGAFLLGIALFGYLALNFPHLPGRVPIHFNALGQADRMAGKITLLNLPAGGILIFIFNALIGSLIYHREKIAAYLLWGGAIIVQIALWIAVLMILGN